MNTATIILWIIALILLGFGWWEGKDTIKRGANFTWEITKRNALVIVLAFLIVGFIEILSPTEIVQAWIGPDSGWKGLILAEIVGLLLPGGPYVVFPLIAILAESGASLASVVTLVTSWSTQSLLTVSFELPFMGWRFTVIRWSMGLLIPLTAGLVTQLIWG